jgi:hypothetical protein
MHAATESIDLLDEPAWRARQGAHEARVRVWTDPHTARAARGEAHPVYDFLFTYYSFRSAWLRQWHPGPGVVLTGAGAREFLRWPEYRETADGVMLDLVALPEKRRVFVEWLHPLLATMEARPAFFGCFGLHEWAMVYRQTPDQVRHNAYPLRFAPDELAQIVEAQPVRCSHFDAFRFFTEPARALNRPPGSGAAGVGSDVVLTRETVPGYEQRGCLHANMDLYKWAFKLAPYAPAELVADCFELARDIREMDMRASPYDLRALGFAPIKIETPEGRAEYERKQREFAGRGEPLRARLRVVCAGLVR